MGRAGKAVDLRQLCESIFIVVLIITVQSALMMAAFDLSGEDFFPSFFSLPRVVFSLLDQQH